MSTENAMAFPDLEVSDLSGQNMQLLDSTRGKPSLVMVSYRQYGLQHAAKWLEDFAEGFYGLNVVKLSVVEHSILRWAFQGFVRSTIRDALPAAVHDSTFVTFRDDAAWRDKVDVLNRCVCHLYILDADGNIRWRSAGPPAEAEIAAFPKLASQLLQEGRG